MRGLKTTLSLPLPAEPCDVAFTVAPRRASRAAGVPVPPAGGPARGPPDRHRAPGNNRELSNEHNAQKSAKRGLIA
jgi:hypothetical protein